MTRRYRCAGASSPYRQANPRLRRRALIGRHPSFALWLSEIAAPMVHESAARSVSSSASSCFACAITCSRRGLHARIRFAVEHERREVDHGRVLGESAVRGRSARRPRRSAPTSSSHCDGVGSPGIWACVLPCPAHGPSFGPLERPRARPRHVPGPQSVQFGRLGSATCRAKAWVSGLIPDFSSTAFAEIDGLDSVVDHGLDVAEVIGRHRCRRGGTRHRRRSRAQPIRS